MRRRAFIRNTALGAIAVSASGFIYFNGQKYVGDCETTSDILGPFYRPGSPVRSNLAAKDEAGTRVELSGVIKHNDCVTPFRKAKIELWHCSSKGEYDNASDEFRNRGTVLTDDGGRYFFTTILPVPYNVGGDYWRPAHFHLMVTAKGYQPFVTQLYFSGDAHIAKDPYASSPAAKKRVLNVQSKTDGTKTVLFDVSLSKKLDAEPAALDKLAGVYVNEKNSADKTELFVKDKLLWVKNNVYGESMEYIGNNTFQSAGLPAGMTDSMVFEIAESGAVKFAMNANYSAGENKTAIYVMQR